MRFTNTSPFLLASCVMVVFATNTFALDCPAPPVQANKDWDTKIQAEVGKIGPVKGAQLETHVRSTTVDLLSKLPAADRVYVEQMFFAAFCTALRDNASMTESAKVSEILAYRRELQKIPTAAQAPVKTSPQMRP